MRTVFFKPYHKAAFLISLLLIVFQSFGQKNRVDSYIDSAWQSNLVLKQKNISFERAQTALSIAKSYFLPEISFLLGYQTAGGGRSIDLPLGDLLNEAYTSLNQLTGTNRFPQLDNQSVNFFPRDFHDAKIRTSIAIINPDIRYNREIAEKQIGLNQFEIEIYKRDIAVAVKTAYYNYLSALRSISIYDNALLLAEEGRRVNQRLLDNGKGLPAYVLRSESEVEQVRAAISTARQQAMNATHYFNFLLNRDQSATIDTSDSDESEVTFGIEMQAEQLSLTANREELKALDQVLSIQESQLNLRKSAFSPRLNGFLDVGNQSENWKFNTQSRYYLLGLQLELPLFTGYRNRNRIRQAQLEMRSAELNLQQSSQQFGLAARTALNNLTAAKDRYRASLKQLEAISAYQRLIERGYREGTNSFIETVDARNQFTQAQLQNTINKYKVLIAVAELERQTASYPIK